MFCLLPVSGAPRIQAAEEEANFWAFDNCLAHHLGERECVVASSERNGSPSARLTQIGGGKDGLHASLNADCLLDTQAS